MRSGVVVALWASVLAGCGGEETPGRFADRPEPRSKADVASFCKALVTDVQCDGTQLRNPSVYFIYYGDWWLDNGTFRPPFTYQSARDYTDQRWSTVLNDPAFWSVIGEYGVGVGSWAGSAVVPGAAPATVRLADAERVAYGFGVIQSGVINVVLLPPGTTFSNPSGFSGQHHYHPPTWIFPGQVVAVVGPPGRGFTNDLGISHEIFEAATDPISATIFSGCVDHNRFPWMDPSGRGEYEIGDFCDLQGSPSFTLDGVTLEKMWSQQACSCVGPQPG